MSSKYKMKAERIENTPKNIYKLETLRFQAYDIKEKFEGYTFYAMGLSEGTMVPYGFFINDELAAGCYVSSAHGTLYIEQLFVHPSIQNSGLRAGRLLLNFILIQKEELENYFGTKFSVSALEASNDKARALYEKMGYVPGELLMRKPI